MIHVDALDFSECRSEEVTSFFWRSVYINGLDIIHYTVNMVDIVD